MVDKSEDNGDKAIKEDDVEQLHEASAEVNPDEPQEASTDAKLEQMEKDHLYLRAELENIKRQNIKERSQLLKFGGERLARDLLDTLDVFKSALSGEINADNYAEFVKGIELTAQSLKAALEKHGVTEVECVGQPFDPNTQEALSSEPSDEYPEGYVTQVFKSPYTFHDKLLRPGQVIVSRSKSEVQ